MATVPRIHMLVRIPRLLSLSSSHIRHLHSQNTLSKDNSQLAMANPTQISDSRSPTLHHPLAILPFGMLLRSYLITSLSSSPLLLNTSLRVLSSLAHSKSAILSPDRNPLLHFILKKTFYAQFCAGETAAEVERVTKSIKNIGFGGIILGYAREVVLSDDETAGEAGGGLETAKADVESWMQGTLETLNMTDEGDQVALKFSGAGSQALRELEKAMPPNQFLEAAIINICELAKARKVRLLFDAEQHALQAGIDAWTLDFQERYNRDTFGQALIYGTYQAYKHETPAILSRHLSIASEKGFTLGVKLVRGAYLSCDPRHLFWSTKNETDKAYNEIAEALIRRKYNNMLVFLHKKQAFPQVNLVLATHNLETVKKTISIRNEQCLRGEEIVPLVYSQLQGMADIVSCELVQTGKMNKVSQQTEQQIETPKTYKYLVWGSVTECLHYLLRRAQENKDTVTRTEESRLALRSELGRRVFGA